MITAGPPRSHRPAWWDIARHAAAAMTAPKTDVGRSDEQLIDVLSSSRAARLLTDLRAVLGRAWTTSATRQAAASVRREWSLLEPAAALRAAGVTVITACAVALILQSLAPDSGGWFAAVLPIAGAVSGIGVIALATRLARMTDGRRL